MPGLIISTIPDTSPSSAFLSIADALTQVTRIRNTYEPLTIRYPSTCRDRTHTALFMQSDSIKRELESRPDTKGVTGPLHGFGFTPLETMRFLGAVRECLRDVQPFEAMRDDFLVLHNLTGDERETTNWESFFRKEAEAEVTDFVLLRTEQRRELARRICNDLGLGDKKPVNVEMDGEGGYDSGTSLEDN